MLLCTKILMGIVAGIILGHFLGEAPVTSGWFAGISTLAIVAALNDTNGGLYMSLMGQYGSADEAAAYSIMTLESGPFLTMVTLGVAGLAAFPWQTLVGAILPLAAGIILGNLDRELKDFLGRAAPVMIPFFAFALGTTLNLHLVWRAGFLGLALGVGVVVLSGASCSSRINSPAVTAPRASPPRPPPVMRPPCQHSSPAPTTLMPRLPPPPPSWLPPALSSAACWCRY